MEPTGTQEVLLRSRERFARGRPEPYNLAMATSDTGYKRLFSHRDMVADLLTGFIHEPWVAECKN